MATQTWALPSHFTAALGSCWENLNPRKAGEQGGRCALKCTARFLNPSLLPLGHYSFGGPCCGRVRGMWRPLQAAPWRSSAFPFLLKVKASLGFATVKCDNQDLKVSKSCPSRKEGCWLTLVTPYSVTRAFWPSLI